MTAKEREWKRLGLTLRFAATFLYVAALMGTFQFVLETVKGFEIYTYIGSVRIAFGGAWEVLILTLLVAIGARIVDIWAKTVYPKLKRGRGWGDLTE